MRPFDLRKLALPMQTELADEKASSEQPVMG
jgi:hypothetical protein